MSQSIGDLNGRWQFLFKVSVAIIPIIGFILTMLIPWFIWVTTSVFELQHYLVSTHAKTPVEQNDIIMLNKHDRDIEKIEEVIKELPPPDWRKRITKIEDAVLLNLNDHTDIKINLEKIKSKLGVDE